MVELQRICTYTTLIFNCPCFITLYESYLQNFLRCFYFWEYMINSLNILVDLLAGNEFLYFIKYWQATKRWPANLFGAPDWIRTSGLPGRSRTLYPTELRTHIYENRPSRRNSAIQLYKSKNYCKNGKINQQKRSSQIVVSLPRQRTQNRAKPAKYKASQPQPHTPPQLSEPNDACALSN